MYPAEKFMTTLQKIFVATELSTQIFIHIDSFRMFGDKNVYYVFAMSFVG